MITKSCALILPLDILKCLHKTDITLLDLIYDLCRLTGRKVPSGALYTCASEKWLAGKLGRSREWVSKSVCKLTRLGLLDRVRRRKVDGFFQTNIYRVGSQIKKGFQDYKSLLFQYLSRVKSRSHIVHKDKEREVKTKELRVYRMETSDSTLEEVLLRMKQRHECMT